MSAMINCCCLFNVSVLKARKHHEGTSCLGKNTSELDPLRAVSPEWGGIVQISVPGKINLYFLPNCQGQNKPRASCWEMTTDQMGSLASLPGGSLTALGRNTWSPLRLRLKSWHNIARGIPQNVYPFAEPKGPQELCDLKNATSSICFSQLVLRRTSVQSGVRSDENRKISVEGRCHRIWGSTRKCRLLGRFSLDVRDFFLTSKIVLAHFLNLSQLLEPDRPWKSCQPLAFVYFRSPRAFILFPKRVMTDYEIAKPRT